MAIAEASNNNNNSNGNGNNQGEKSIGQDICVHMKGRASIPCLKIMYYHFRFVAISNWSAIDIQERSLKTKSIAITLLSPKTYV